DVDRLQRPRERHAGGVGGGVSARERQQRSAVAEERRRRALGEVAHHLGVADAKRVATLAAGLAVQLTAVEAEVAAPEVGEVAVVATPADAAAEVEVRALVVEPSEVAELLRLVADVESTGVDAAGRALRIRARRALPLRGVDLRRRCARDAED